MSDKRNMKPAEIQWKSNIETLTVELEFLTPVFGGGYAAGKDKAPHQKPHDEFTPVRSAGLRGALRFWWRATSGAWCGSIQEMHEREAEIFGSTEKAGQLSLWVYDSRLSHRDYRVMELTNSGRAKALQGHDGMFYGCFPMQAAEGAQINTPGVLHQYKGTFDVSLQYPKQYLEEIRLAVSALVAFGGLGGRSTRGFGQVAETEGSNKLLSPEKVLNQIRRQGFAKVGNAVPAISHDSIHYVSKQARPNDNGETLLNSALNNLKIFRQGSQTGRRKGQGSRPGRSYWPEPEAVRHATGSRDRGHQKLPVQVRAYPRANFGLPIIFHFQSRTDPRDTSLQPTAEGKALERMRSPLQISVHRDGYSYLVLTAPRADELTLKGAGGDPTVRASITNNERQELAEQGGRSRELFTAPRTGSDYNVLDAFLQFVSNGR